MLEYRRLCLFTQISWYNSRTGRVSFSCGNFYDAASANMFLLLSAFEFQRDSCSFDQGGGSYRVQMLLQENRHLQQDCVLIGPY